MPGLATLGFGNSGQVLRCLGARSTMTAIASEDAAIIKAKWRILVEDERFRDDMVELDDLTGNVEPAAFAADVAMHIHGAFEHGNFLGAGELATSVHQAAST
ncbi:MAG: hypothetical protein QHC89_26605 [Bosea sp. (in: a-proteobacteria)]|nr:hypothetical protein [Bosea sp. (in: a-proteobacteria)]